MEDENAQDSMELIGTTLADRFQVEKLIGKGGQAETYLATDSQDDQKVVIKRLVLQRAETWKEIELFEREANALRALDHPRIPGYVQFINEQDDGKGDLFLVQRYVQGQDLETLLKEGRWDEPRIRRFLLDMLDILEYLQSLQPPVVHRDIKPSNIVIDADGAPHLVDFGAVQLISNDRVGGSTIVGTSGYMPFEQFSGRAVPATDVYALAATVLFTASGKHPSEFETTQGVLDFRPHTNLSTALATVLDDMLRGAPENRVWRAEELRAGLKGKDAETPQDEILDEEGDDIAVWNGTTPFPRGRRVAIVHQHFGKVSEIKRDTDGSLDGVFYGRSADIVDAIGLTIPVVLGLLGGFRLALFGLLALLFLLGRALRSPKPVAFTIRPDNTVIVNGEDAGTFVAAEAKQGAVHLHTTGGSWMWALSGLPDEGAATLATVLQQHVGDEFVLPVQRLAAADVVELAAEKRHIGEGTTTGTCIADNEGLRLDFPNTMRMSFYHFFLFFGPLVALGMVFFQWRFALLFFLFWIFSLVLTDKKRTRVHIDEQRYVYIDGKPVAACLGFEVAKDRLKVRLAGTEMPRVIASGIQPRAGAALAAWLEEKVTGEPVILDHEDTSAESSHSVDEVAAVEVIS